MGTTTVTCTANDACGQTATCNFTVTVLPPIPEYFTPFYLLPPPDTVYISPALWHVLYNNGIVIRDVRHRFFTDHFPPPPTGVYISPQLWHALFAQGIVIRDVRHKLFTQSFLPPPPGGSNTHSFNSIVDLQLSTDGGQTYQYVRASAPVTVQVASVGSRGLYDTEMLLLNLDDLPNGLKIRESPTLPSRGSSRPRFHKRPARAHASNAPAHPTERV